MIDIISRILICLYWIVLICFNIRNFKQMEAAKRNVFIYLLIIVNALVIIATFIGIFKPLM